MDLKVQKQRVSFWFHSFPAQPLNSIYLAVDDGFWGEGGCGIEIMAVIVIFPTVCWTSKSHFGKSAKDAQNSQKYGHENKNSYMQRVIGFLFLNHQEEREVRLNYAYAT